MTTPGCHPERSEGSGGLLGTHQLQVMQNRPEFNVALDIFKFKLKLKMKV
jgi:hypothetical protein